MTAYELTVKTNHYLIKGGKLTDAHKASITRQLFEAQNGKKKKPRFIEEGGTMYPQFYIPPYNNGQKFQTVIPMSPKTHILAANSYELEIIRLLHMFAQRNEDVCHMVNTTLDRLRKTCFGYKSCYTGECFEAGIVTLRFISTVAPTQTSWIKKQMNVFNNHYADKRRPGGVQQYYWLCLSEMPLDIARPEILKRKDDILNQLGRKSKVKDEDSHLVITSAMQNALARLQQ